LGIVLILRKEPMNPPETAKSAKVSLKKALLFFLKFAVAGGIIAWMIHKYHANIEKSLTNIEPAWLITAFALYLFSQIACAFRFMLLLNVQNIKISFKESFSLLMIGNFFSLVIPGGSVGGDIPKAGFLASRTKKGEKLKGVFTILIDRVIGMVALFSFAAMMALLCFKYLSNLNGVMVIAVYTLLFGCVFGLAATIVLLFHRTLEKISLIRWLIGLGNRLTKGSLSTLMSAMDDFRKKYVTLILCLLISIFFVHANIVVVIMCMAKGLGVQNMNVPLFLFVTVIGNAAGTIPLTPSGVGTRDIIMQKLLAAIGIVEQSAAIPIIFSCFVLLFNLSGGIFLLLRKGNDLSHEDMENTKKI